MFKVISKNTEIRDEGYEGTNIGTFETEDEANAQCVKWIEGDASVRPVKRSPLRLRVYGANDINNENILTTFSINCYGYIIKRSYMMGRQGYTGTKTHWLRVEEVVGVMEPGNEKGNTYGRRWLNEQQRNAPRPVYYSVTALCNGNGQHTGTVTRATEVTCKRCA